MLIYHRHAIAGGAVRRIPLQSLQEKGTACIKKRERKGKRKEKRMGELRKRSKERVREKGAERVKRKGSLPCFTPVFIIKLH